MQRRERVRIARIEAAKALVGFAPSTDLATGLDRFVAWYRDYYQV